MTQQIPIGVSDFSELRTECYYYLDKSGLVSDVVRSGAKIILLPRPRRFGKTINLSMLKAFFDCSRQNAESLFAGLEVTEDEEVMQHCGGYPTVFFDLQRRQGSPTSKAATTQWLASSPNCSWSS